MARIAGVDLPRDKRVEIGLTYIYARPFSFCHLTDRSIKQYYKGCLRSARPPAGGVLAATCQVSHFIILTAEQRIHARPRCSRT